mmetsp:Transcript_65138/g.153339  ORF Transcript_65138/g.153339 Transcript_65138/m.153339 type:complete len:388 (-) Transcript_65138:78-1241(-)
MFRNRATLLSGFALLLGSATLCRIGVSFAPFVRTTPAGFVNGLASRGPRFEFRPLTTSAASSQVEAKNSAPAAAGCLLAGTAFWAFMYWLFFKAIAHLTLLIKGRPNLETATFALLSLLPLSLVRRGAVHYGVDKPLETLARCMSTPGLQHMVRCLIPAAHSMMTALLLFFSVNLLASAVPANFQFVLPEHLKAIDPNRNGILTGTELETVVEDISVRLMKVIIYFELGVFGLLAVQKPRSYQALGQDVIDRYWRSLDQRIPKAVIFFLLLYSVILLFSAAGILRALGLAPRSILALGGVSGLAFGLASQNLVGNFMSGILLIVNGQFSVGDRIETNGVQGIVRAMGWTFIEIQREEDLVMLPNSQVVGTTVVQIGHFAKKGETTSE